MKDIIKANGLIGYIFIKNEETNIYIYRNDKFVKAETEDVKDFAKVLKKFRINKEDYNNIIGFYSVFRTGGMVFKTKDIHNMAKRNIGTKCDQTGKAAIIKVFNKIFRNNERYTKDKLERYNNAIQLCSEQEMYLRYFDKTKKDNKRWFLSSTEARLNQIHQQNK